jgi:hypothetical protein
MTMPLMNIDDPDSGPATRITLFDLGFRPFFLLAGITAPLPVPLWIHAYSPGGIEPGYYPAMVAWHSSVAPPASGWCLRGCALTAWRRDRLPDAGSGH